MRIPTAIMRGAIRAGRPVFRTRAIPTRLKRKGIDAITGLTAAPAGTRRVRAEVGGVSGLWVTPPGARPDAVLLYLHGGGFGLGTAKAYSGFAAQVAAQIGVKAFLPDYRLAPENPFPAAIDDVISSYEGLIDDGYAPERIIVAGDSAGGGLSLSLAMEIRDRGLDSPAAVGLICPWLDLAADLSGTRPSVPNPLLTADMTERWASEYVGANVPTQQTISPLLGDLRGLPPIVLHYAGDDPLVADGDQLAARALAADLAIEHVRFDGVWHVFHVHAGIMAASDEAVADFGARLRRKIAPAQPSDFRVGVIGAGMSGVAVAHRLQQAGVDFSVYEKASSVGGTWRDNRYPGLTCDVPASYYTYSWKSKHDWSRFFAAGPEIRAYFEQVVEETDLARHIEFDAEIVSARYDAGRWAITTRDGRTDTVDAIVAATGTLHHPRVPALPGLDTFSGASFHSSQWDDSVSTEGRRVAVVGNGSTGVQIITALGGRAEQVLAFQRTPQWVAPMPNFRRSKLARKVMRADGIRAKFVYRGWQRVLELTAGRAVIDDSSWQWRLFASVCRANLRLSVRDPELRRKLTPDYEPMCKRLVVSGGFYRAIQRSDVQLVTEDIDHVVPSGIVTADGRLHEVDVIVLATGFDAQAFMRPMEIVGEDGLSLNDAWSPAPSAYLTTMIPGFPNLFMLLGPGSPIGNQSLVPVAEVQADFAMHWIDVLRGGTATSVAPAATATLQYNELRRQAMEGTTWVSGCNSWYIGKDGLPSSWPWRPELLRSVLATTDRSAYVIGTSTAIAVESAS